MLVVRGTGVAAMIVLTAACFGQTFRASASGHSKGKGKGLVTGSTSTTTATVTTTTVTTLAPAPTTTATTTTTTVPAPVPTTTTPAPTPSGHALYWGAWIGSQFTGTQPPWDMTAVSAFASRAGKPPSIINWSSPFYSSAWCNGYCTFATSNFDNVRRYGAIPFFSWNSAPGTGSFTDAKIASGAQDAYIDAWATAAKNWGHPFFLRFNWEMNGSWMAWGVGANGNTASDYVAMWRHVHDRFAAIGATNVNWVWCPNIDQWNQLTPMSQVYPGNSYVDWTCLDGYNWGTDPAGHASGWQTFDQVFHSSYHQIVDTIAPTKPMVIGEVSSTEYGGSKAMWTADMLQNQLPQNYPHINAFVWFEKGGSEGDNMDWPIESSSSDDSAFANAIANPMYRSNVYGSLGGTLIAAP
ncbi:MAG TPA: glycosyl hydrolase [Acidimicrobiia bacterium]|nr:glycosyl hydrolase [Acidimicrobiia bacterium]